jgi:hypothetical protein
MITQRDKNIFMFIENYGGITINQAAKLFYPQKKSYDNARMRLKKHYNDGLLSRYLNGTTKEYVYCYKEHKELSMHDISILDFYSELVSYGVKINVFQKERQWSDGKFRSDAFLEFEYNENLYLLCLEIDLTHKTSIKNKYVKLYESNEIQNLYSKYGDGIFPKILIASFNEGTVYEEYPFDVTYMNLNFDGFIEKILL